MPKDKSLEHLEKLKKDLLETGILNQQKIEDVVKEQGIKEIKLSNEAKEMKQIKSKVNSIFDKHLKKENDMSNTQPQQSQITEAQKQYLEMLQEQLLDDIETSRAARRAEEIQKLKSFMLKYDSLIEEQTVLLQKPKLIKPAEIEQDLEKIEPIEKNKEEKVLDLTPYLQKEVSIVDGLIAAGAVFSIFGIFFPNPITPTVSYLVLLTLVAKIAKKVGLQ